jgi:hypothetical protein
MNHNIHPFRHKNVFVFVFVFVFVHAVICTRSFAFICIALHAHFPTIPVSASSYNILVMEDYFYLRPPPPLPRPRPRPRPPSAIPTSFGATDFLGVSSTNRASKLRLSGSNQARIVEPRTESVAYETGFLPRLLSKRKEEHKNV